MASKWHLGVAQFGSVLEWGSRGRRFDSCHPDQLSAVIMVRIRIIVTAHNFYSKALI